MKKQVEQNEAAKEAKRIFSDNLKYYMDIRGKTQADIVADLNFKSSSVSAWVNGEKYARVDKMQKLADYFGIVLSDLREKKQKEKPITKDELQKELDDIFIKLSAEQRREVLNYVHYLESHQGNA